MSGVSASPTQAGLAAPPPPAVFSPDRVHRYVLNRTVDPDLLTGSVKPGYVAWIGLNPSVADEYKLDNTCRRCLNWVKKWGFSRYVMLNAFSLVSTDPKALYTHPDPIGPENDRWLRLIGHGAALLIAAWGTHGKFMGRGAQVAAMFPGKLHCLRVTADGHPSHPLYLPGELEPVPYAPPGTT